MAVAIVRKAFDNLYRDLINSPTNYTLPLHKFVCKAFNQLSHDQEISELLVASYLYDLPNYDSSTVNIKMINIAFLQAK